MSSTVAIITYSILSRAHESGRKTIERSNNNASICWRNPKKLLGIYIYIFRPCMCRLYVAIRPKSSSPLLRCSGSCLRARSYHSKKQQHFRHRFRTTHDISSNAFILITCFFINDFCPSLMNRNFAPYFSTAWTHTGAAACRRVTLPIDATNLTLVSNAWSISSPPEHYKYMVGLYYATDEGLGS